MSLAVRVSVAPTQEPLSLAEARAHLRVDSYDDDGIIAGLILAAREYCEQITGRVLCTQTLVLTMDGFPRCQPILLPRGPIQSITTVKYINASGVQTTWSGSEWQADLYSNPPRIEPAYGLSWPDARLVYGAVEVTFVAGYGGPELVPQSFLQAMRLLLGHWYENREAVTIGSITSELDFTVKALLAPHRLSWL